MEYDTACLIFFKSSFLRICTYIFFNSRLLLTTGAPAGMPMHQDWQQHPGHHSQTPQALDFRGEGMEERREGALREGMANAGPTATAAAAAAAMVVEDGEGREDSGAGGAAQQQEDDPIVLAVVRVVFIDL